MIESAKAKTRYSFNMSPLNVCDDTCDYIGYMTVVTTV